MTAKMITDLLSALSWPCAVIISVILLRSQIPAIIGRTRKIGALGVELELEPVSEFVPKWSAPNLADVRHATGADQFSSNALALMEEFGGDGSYDYAVVDLGTGRSWLTSRLYIVSDNAAGS